MRVRRGLLRQVSLPVRDDVVKALVDNHRRFLAFLERRVGSREAAEDILQDGFVRALERTETLRSGESAVAWFYRLLRNLLIDHHRRSVREDRAVSGAALEIADGVDEELRETVGACVVSLLETLKPEYRDALRRVEMEGEKVGAYAQEVGISASNASVRLHRAREALRRRLIETCGTCATHGCRDCECRRSPTSSSLRSVPAAR